MSFFSEEWGRDSKRLDDHFGELFDHTPMAQTGGRFAADPERPATIGFTACLWIDAAISDPTGQRNGSAIGKGVAHQISSGAAVIDFDINALAATPRARDRFIRQSDGAVFEVTGVLADDLPRFGVRVVRL